MAYLGIRRRLLWRRYLRVVKRSSKAEPGMSCHCWGIRARRPGDPAEMHADWCPVSRRAR